VARSANSEPSGAPAKTSGSARNTWAKSQAQRLRVGEGVVLIGVVVAAAADGGTAELVTGRGGWPSLGRLGLQRGHDLSPQSGVAREDAKIPEDCFIVGEEDRSTVTGMSRACPWSAPRWFSSVRFLGSVPSCAPPLAS
jgi:hypothetical protein